VRSRFALIFNAKPPNLELRRDKCPTREAPLQVIEKPTLILAQFYAEAIARLPSALGALAYSGFQQNNEQ